MPLYEFRCDKCGNVEEVLMTYPPAEVLARPACGEAAGLVPSVFGLTIPGFKNGQAITEDTLLGEDPK